MRIRVSSPGRFKEYQAGQIDDFLWELRESILAQMESDVYDLSQYRIKKIGAVVNAVVNYETGAIFQTAANIISESKSFTHALMKTKFYSAPEVPGFSASRIYDAKNMMDLAAMPMMGGVNWRDLTQRWARTKRRNYPGSEKKFFIYSGSLLNWMRREKYGSGKAGKFGGATVRRSMVSDLKKRRLTRGDTEWALDRLVIEVYPNIPSILLPMLTSFDWRDHSEGLFEKRMIGGVIGDKLAGPEGYHRPLLQPLTQFWIAYRLPRVVAQTIERVLKAKDP